MTVQPMLHYRRYEFRLQDAHGLAGARTRVFEVLHDAGFESPPVRVFFEDASSGASGCERILSRFPDFQPLAPPRRAGPLATRQPLRLYNLDTHWDAGGPGPTAEIPRETLLTLAAGVPDEFPLGAASVIIGPLDWDGSTPRREAAARRQPPGTPPFSARFPAATYLAPGVILQRLSTGSISVTITEQVLEPSLEAARPPVIERLLAALGAPVNRRVITVPLEHEVTGAPLAPKPDPAEIQARYRDHLADLVSGLTLPNELPGPMEALKLQHEPLGEIRKTIVRTFAADGWKRSARRIPAGSHELSKLSPGGRRLALSFDTGSWSRHVVSLMMLMTERGTMKLPLPVLAGGSLHVQYHTPNPQVFGQVLENLRAVVEHLERTWVAELEHSLGPIPEGYHPPEL